MDQQDRQWPRQPELGRDAERPTFDTPANAGSGWRPGAGLPPLPRYGLSGPADEVRRTSDAASGNAGMGGGSGGLGGNGANGANGANGLPASNAFDRLGPADDEGDVPPWERSSARYPRPPVTTATPEVPTQWEWEPAIEQSYTGANAQEFTGTGRISAIVPLRAGQAIGTRGTRSPRSQGLSAASASIPLEDDAPSVQMRAMRAGNLARATLIVSGALLLSRVLGLFRTSFFAATFGSGGADVTGPLKYAPDAYTYAFTIPDMIFTIVAGGALASAFIPVFTSYMVEKRDRKSAWRIASSALNLALVTVTLCAILMIIFTPQVVHLVFGNLFVGAYCTPGIGCEGDMVISLTRIMLLQPIFLGGATIAVAILQARQSFVLPSLAQVIYTISLIGGIEFARYQNPAQPKIEYAAWGVVVGAALQLLIQIPGLVQAKMKYTLTLDIFHPGIREVFRLMAPRLLNAAMLYVSVLFNRWLLSFGDVGQGYGYVTAFTLILLPTGIFGMAVSQAAFPTLAAFVAGGQWDKLRATVMRTFRGISYLALPSAFGMIALADPITRLILAHGNFDPTQLPKFTGPLIMFATGLLGLAVVEILTRSFYAIQDTRTPTEVSILQFMFSIGLSLILMQSMGANGLALASAIAWNGEALVLLILLAPRLDGINFRELGRFLLNVLAASVITAVVARGVYQGMVMVLPPGVTSVTETLHEATRVIVAVVVGCVAFFGSAHFLRIDDTMPLKSLVRRVIRR